jgi:hypothetical protein
MDMIAQRNMLDFSEPRMRQVVSQGHMANDSVAPQADRGGAHSHLKRNSRFLRNNADATATSYQRSDPSKQVDGVRGLSDEMLLQGVARTEMRLIPVGKRPSALRLWLRRGIEFCLSARSGMSRCGTLSSSALRPSAFKSANLAKLGCSKRRPSA